MSKIICDVCGTRYPESAEQCPICGCVPNAGTSSVEDSIVMDEDLGGERPRVRGGRFSKSNVRKRNKNMPSYEIEEPKARPKAKEEEIQDEYEYDEIDEPRSKANLIINILLVIVIIALLAVTGYIFIEFFMPNLKGSQEPVPSTTEALVESTAAPTETEEPTVPCTDLVMTEFETTLENVGDMYLLNVAVEPADTTDTIMYLSSDENVVTVNEEGRITAVGEGEATVTIICGTVEQQFIVTCAFVPEETVIINWGDEETVPDTEETGEATEAPTEGPTEPLKDITLQVNYTDLTLTAHGQQYTLKVTGLSNEEVTWISEDESIVTVENGTLTRVGKGTANVIAKYGDQEVTIIVRCR